MHTYIHTPYLLICTCAYSLLWRNGSRFCLVVQYNSYLLLTVYIRRSLPFVFIPSHYFTYKRAFLRNFNFCGIAWFLFTFICACPGSVTVLLGADNAAYEQRVMCGKTRHQVHSCVCVSLFGDLPCQLIALFTANLYATFLFISLNCLICIKRQATVSGLETDRQMEMRVNTQRTNCLCLDRHSGIRRTTSKRQIKVIIKPKGASSPRAPLQT